MPIILCLSCFSLGPLFVALFFALLISGLGVVFGAAAERWRNVVVKFPLFGGLNVPR